jgi:hypothetical protein
MASSRNSKIMPFLFGFIVAWFTKDTITNKIKEMKAKRDAEKAVTQ